MTLKLSQFVDELSTQNNEYHLYLRKEDGEIVGITDETISQFENLDQIGLDNYQDWEIEEIKRVEMIMENETYLRFPTSYDIHEYQIMEDFVDQIQSESLRWTLQRAIQGKGAFSRFKQQIYQNGIEEEWFVYKTKTLASISRVWLEDHEIEFIDDLKEESE